MTSTAPMTSTLLGIILSSQEAAAKARRERVRLHYQEKDKGEAYGRNPREEFARSL